MKKTIELSIPSPCHENWNSFAPTTQGGFCGSCRKEVIDFTLWDEEDIKAYFKNGTLNTCGRFQQKQLKTYTIDQPHTSLPVWIPAVVMSALLVFTSKHAGAQTKGKMKPDTVQYDQKQILLGDTTYVATSHIKVSGIVLSGDDHSPMPGISILRKGTTQGTTSDAKGHYTIDIDVISSSETLVFSFIGMTTIEREVNVSHVESEMNVTLAVDVVGLNEVVVIAGGIVSLPSGYSPRGLWWRMRNLFTR